MFKKRSFLEKLTGGIRMRTDEDLFEDDDPTVEEEESPKESRTLSVKKVGKKLDKKTGVKKRKKNLIWKMPSHSLIQTMKI
jgi:hypothetical protein